MIAWTVAVKDLRLFLRDRAALLFTVLVPAVVIAIVAGTQGGREGGFILLPFVDDDGGPVPELLAQTLAEHVVIERVDLETAQRWVGRENRAAAALVIPEGTSKNYLTDRASTLTLLTDPAKGPELNTIRALLLLADREAAAVADPLYEELLHIEEDNLTGTRKNARPADQNVPGFSVMFVLMGVLFGVAFGLREEEDSGTLTRLRIAPVPRAVLLGGKLLARFLIGVAQMAVLFAFGHWVFGVSLGPSIATFGVLVVAVVFCMTGFSLLVSAFVGSREQIIPLGLTVVMLVCSVGGCWWPLFQEPLWLQQAAQITPTAWAMVGVTDLILRERTLVEIAPILGVLLIYGAGCLLLGARFHRFARTTA